MSLLPNIPNVPKQVSEMLTNITDPYHDFNLRPTGYPDGKAIASAIQRICTRVDISCPFTLAGGETWDFHVFTTPLHNVTLLSPGLISQTNNLITVATTDAYQQIGPVNVLYKRYDSNGVVNSTNLQALDAIAPQVDTQRRTVSLGFELHNTTAELYKAGALTTYRAPVLCNQDVDMTLTTTGTATTGWYHASFVGQVPYALSDAQRIPNSRTWNASEGAYCVALPYHDNQFSPLMAQNIILKAGILSNSVLIKRSLTTQYPSQTTWSPLSCPGVMSSQFANKEQTFTLDMRQIIESIPTSDNSTIISFAVTAPQLDRTFLKLYKQMFNNVPPGVPVNFNSAGDWFRMIANLVKEAIPTIIPLLPPNVRAITTVAAPIVNKLIDKAINKPAPKINVTQRMVKPNIIKKALLQQHKSKARTKRRR